jgi:hypothetical protein
MSSLVTGLRLVRLLTGIVVELKLTTEKREAERREWFRRKLAARVKLARDEFLQQRTIPVLLGPRSWRLERLNTRLRSCVHGSRHYLYPQRIGDRRSLRYYGHYLQRRRPSLT